MRYYIDFDKTINQLVPYYIKGRKLILYLQALMSPLRQLNDEFVSYAKEKRIEMAMTSQTIMFEWYLNRKFSKYFANGGRITISNSTIQGTALYHENANVLDSEHQKVRREPKIEDGQLVAGEEGETMVLYRSDEYTDENSVSFVVYTPAINTSLITTDKYAAMLRYYIDKYRLGNKTYIIKHEQS